MDWIIDLQLAEGPTRSSTFFGAATHQAHLQPFRSLSFGLVASPPSTTPLGRGCHPCLKYVLLPMCPVWTAPAVQGEFDVSAMVGCGHVFGLFLQPLWLLAMM
jgi:hypothetical protein